MKKLIITAATALAVSAIAAPSMAAITPFASYSAVGNSGNVRLVVTKATTTTKVGKATTKHITYSYSFQTAKNGSGGLAAVPINFSFLQPQLVTSAPIKADFTFLASSTQVASKSGTTGQDVLGGFVGGTNSNGYSFSIISTAAFTTSFGVTYGVGSNLLSGTFSPGSNVNSIDLTAQDHSTSGSFTGSVGAGGLVNFTSDMLDFTNTINRDFSLGFVSATPPATFTAGTDTTVNGANGATTRTIDDGHLAGFKALANGNFSSDPAPLVNGAVPEAATWAMMLVGFGGIGGMLRTNRRRADLFA